MSIATPPRRFTPEDLLTMPDGDRYELVDGELVERHMSMESSWIAGELFAQLHAFIRVHKLGWVFPEGTSYQCFPEERSRVRKPDTSFIRRERLPNGPLPQGHCPIPPDLVVEVVSPNDLFYEVDIKVEEWLRAGTSEVWVVVPATRSVWVHRHSQPTPTRLHEDGELTSDTLLPGFRCRVRDLFPDPTTPTTPASRP